MLAISTCLRARPAAAALGVGTAASYSAVRVGVLSRGFASFVPRSVVRPTFQHPPAALYAQPGFSTASSASSYRTTILGGVTALLLSFAAWGQQATWCEPLAKVAPEQAAAGSSLPDPLGEPAPQSILDAKQLTFGTVAGVCTGIFVKKGLKLIGFALGGIFVLLQYMSSQKWLSINWKSIGSRYDSLVDVAAGSSSGPKSSNRAWLIWQRFAHFLTHNFQERATFLAGFVLGMRLG